MTIIYEWPPVACLSTMWVERQPVRTSVSAVSGQRFVSTSGPRRREAYVAISALSRARDGQGYADSLRRFLDGGVNLVRLRSPAPNWHLDHYPQRGVNPLNNTWLNWSANDLPLAWTASGPLHWLLNDPVVATATTVGGRPALSVSGLPPGALVCRAFDVIRSLSTTPGNQGSTARAVRTTYADDTGAAVIMLHDALPSGFLSVVDEEVAVFRADIEAVAQPLGENWLIGVNLEEVLPGEIPSGAPVVNPWI